MATKRSVTPKALSAKELSAISVFTFMIPESIRTGIDSATGAKCAVAGGWTDYRDIVRGAVEKIKTGRASHETLTETLHACVIAGMQQAAREGADPRERMDALWKELTEQAVVAARVKNASKLRSECGVSHFAVYPTQYKAMTAMGLIPGEATGLKTHRANGKPLKEPVKLTTSTYSQMRELAKVWTEESAKVASIRHKVAHPFALPAPKKEAEEATTQASLGLPVKIPEFGDFQKVANDLSDLLAKLETKEARASLIATLARVADETRESLVKVVVATKPRKGSGR